MRSWLVLTYNGLTLRCIYSVSAKVAAASVVETFFGNTTRSSIQPLCCCPDSARIYSTTHHIRMAPIISCDEIYDTVLCLVPLRHVQHHFARWAGMPSHGRAACSGHVPRPNVIPSARLRPSAAQLGSQDSIFIFPHNSSSLPYVYTTIMSSHHIRMS